jgi:methionyl-tRNA formyltransferase
MNDSPDQLNKPREKRIVFLGTPEFAVASLDALLAAGCNVVGVVTAADKPGGRGLKLQQSAVKKYALNRGLPIFQPQRLKDELFLSALRALAADIQVVVAFRMLPEAVWNMPPAGTINLHASLLPQYRGAAPINWAIINGEHETGLTTFKLKHEIDTGNILLQDRIPIGENETAGELHDRMKEAGGKLLVNTIQGLVDGVLQEKPQQPASNKGEDEKQAVLKLAPKITTESCRINWSNPIDEIYNLIRGLSPHPSAFTQLDGKTLKIFSATRERTFPPSSTGKWETDRSSYLKFSAIDGYIHVTELQLGGKKRMGVEEFLRGYRFGTITR